MAMDKKFWDGERWDAHAAFNTTDHDHVSCYVPARGMPNCDITVVECDNGRRWYVEDTWGGDAKGEEGVWSPFDPSDAEPTFFESRKAALKHAVKVVSRVCGVPESSVSSCLDEMES